MRGPSLSLPLSPSAALGHLQQHLCVYIRILYTDVYLRDNIAIDDGPEKVRSIPECWHKRGSLCNDHTRAYTDIRAIRSLPESNRSFYGSARKATPRDTRFSSSCLLPKLEPFQATNLPGTFDYEHQRTIHLCRYTVLSIIFRIKRQDMHLRSFITAEEKIRGRYFKISEISRSPDHEKIHFHQFCLFFLLSILVKIFTNKRD